MVDNGSESRWNVRVDYPRCSCYLFCRCHLFFSPKSHRSPQRCVVYRDCSLAASCLPLSARCYGCTISLRIHVRATLGHMDVGSSRHPPVHSCRGHLRKSYVRGSLAPRTGPVATGSVHCLGSLPRYGHPFLVFVGECICRYWNCITANMVRKDANKLQHTIPCRCRATESVSTTFGRKDR